MRNGRANFGVQQLPLFNLLEPEELEEVCSDPTVVPQNLPSHFSLISHRKVLGDQDPVRVSSAQDFSLHC